MQTPILHLPIGSLSKELLLKTNWQSGVFVLIYRLQQ
jgi:hypothetical protein